MKNNTFSRIEVKKTEEKVEYFDIDKEAAIYYPQPTMRESNNFDSVLHEQVGVKNKRSTTIYKK